MKKLILLIVGTLLVVGCGKKEPAAPQPKNPAKSTLVLPGKNSLCTTGTEQSNTQTLVLFKWDQAENTDVYSLTIKDLLTGQQIVKSTSETTISVLLKRNTPYEWYIVSSKLNVSVTQKSDIWRFYTSGVQTVDYAPFPAVVNYPLNGEVVKAPDNKIDVVWNSSDVDNDIAGYDIYMSTDKNALVLLKSGITEMLLRGITVQKGLTYYWLVVTKDKKGNLSTSNIFQFDIN
nr:hypothetical protein [uncultured Mucilaginibacter sp.]